MIAGSAPKSLYVHVPFCRGICYYCDFRRQMYRSDIAERWLKAIAFELLHTEMPAGLETVYIGGGTPTSLSEDQLEELLNLLDPLVKHVKEYTVEVNPETVSEETVQMLCAHGVNRISIGLQTADEKLLSALNRHHAKEDVRRVVDQFFRCGISNISLDLMYGLPHQSMSSLQESAEFALSLSPAHLSLYSLTIEENSVFGKRGVKTADEDTEADMYEWIVSFLKQRGYDHYEISNFARGGMVSKHNVNVWHYDDFIGLGYGAWGKDDKGRYDHADSLRAYLNDPCCRNYTVLSKEEQMYESLMMGLRLREGVSCGLFHERFGASIIEVYPMTVQKYLSYGLLKKDGDRLFCSEEGLAVLNSILVDLMEEAGI